MFLRFGLFVICTILYVRSATIQPKVESKCGTRHADGVIKTESLNKEKQSELGEFPWTVGIFKNDSVTCAGSLIQPNVVLTAGHCVKDTKNDELKIKAGLWDLNNANEKYPIQEKKVSEIIMHPEFSNENKFIKNDIALIILANAVELGDHIGLVCLAAKDYEEKGKDCFATGWGKEDKEGTTPKILKKLHVPTVTNEQCQKKLSDKMEGLELSKSVLCAGGDKASTCIGDGGAPLVCDHDSTEEKHYIQSGIMSWGIGCTPELPGVYTNVAQFRDWIDGNVKKLNLDPKKYEA